METMGKTLSCFSHDLQIHELLANANKTIQHEKKNASVLDAGIHPS